MTITPLYAGLLGLWLIVLSARVINVRRTAGVSLGAGNDTTLERRIRAQGNFAEYAPLALLLIAVLEITQHHAYLLHGLGIMLLAGRLLHGYALSFTQQSSVGRTGGMVLTLFAIGIAAIANILHWAGTL